MGKNTNSRPTTRQRNRRHNGAISATHQGKGRLLVIGGNEDKTDGKMILAELVQLTGTGTLVISTLASRGAADKLWKNYRQVFADLGAKHITHLDIKSRNEAKDATRIEIVKKAGAIFFTGGDQLQLSSQLGGTPLCDHIQAFYYEQGGVIAGTSAGASVLCGTMLVSGNGDESHKIRDTLRMAPGLGFVKDMIIDQHFAERGRIGRLLAAVAQNPRLLGVGIDEDTAILIKGEKDFRVLGSGAVYVIDGRDVTATNISEKDAEHTLSIFDVRLDLLSQGDTFDLETRQAIHHAAKTETTQE